MSTLRIAALGLGLACISGTAVAQDNRLQQVTQRGTLLVCAVNYTPWNIFNPIEDAWTGINTDIVNEIAAAMEVQVEWVSASWATVIQDVMTDKCDLAAAALWTSPARAANVSFTRSIGGDGSTLFVPTDSTVASYGEIDQAGTVIAVMAGSADERLAQSMFQNAEVRSLVTDQLAAHMLEVASGRADAAFGGFAGNAQFVASNPNIRVKPLEDLLVNYIPFAYAVPAREYFFRDYINIVISNLEASGRLDAIMAEWTASGDE